MAKGYMSEWFAFQKEINEADLLVGKAHLVSKYINYMEQKGQLSKLDLEERFNICGSEYSDFDDYVYRHEMGFENDLISKYTGLKSEAESRVKQYSDSISKLEAKIDSELAHYPREKLKFILKINEALLQEAKKRAAPNVLVAKSLAEISPITRDILHDFDFTFFNWEQYDNIDWKHKISFNYLPILESEDLAKMRTNNHAEYLQKYAEYIDDFDFCNEILKLAKKNHTLYRRLPLFQCGMKLYRKAEYLPFIALMILQIEGLFSDYATAIGVNVNGLKSISEKLVRLREDNRIWGYIYFAYEFPILRNQFAHGEMLLGDYQEIAMDLLTQVHHLVELIANHESIPVNFFRKFLDEISHKVSKERNRLIFERLDDLIKQGNLLEYFCLPTLPLYSEIIDFYQLKRKIDKLKDAFYNKRFWNQLLQDEDYAIANMEPVHKLIRHLPQGSKLFAQQYLKQAAQFREEQKE